jgi:hypothetical protein
MRSGAEQNIDRRPVTILTRTYRKVNVLVFDHQMTIRRRHQDFASAQRVTILGRSRWQRPGPRQDVGKHARTIRRDVKHNADSSGEIAR